MVLLDTHVLLWMLFDDSQLSVDAVAALQNNVCCISMTTIREMAIKMSLGKLILPKSIPEIVAECEAMGIQIVDITIEDCVCLRDLPLIHRDPFDRMLISHAMVENMPLVSHDQSIQKYENLRFFTFSCGMTTDSLSQPAAASSL